MSATTVAATPSASTRSVSVSSRGWIRSATFDFHFIISIALVALATGGVSVLVPELFGLFLMLDLWLLGYHHVISTFTRLIFDRASFQENRFLVVQLPIIVVGATVAAVYALGSWVLPTTYLYWQWFHYTRQSYGIERIYRRAADKQSSIDDYVATRTLYLVPIFGILYRSWQQPENFLGMSVWTFRCPTFLLVTSGIIALIAVAIWLNQQVQSYLQGRLATAHCLYVFSHTVIFLVGYFLISDITAGWLVLNVWHNAQYILFVWWFNNKRFQERVDPQSPFLSTICLRKNLAIYMGLCLAISTVFYVALSSGFWALYRDSALSGTLVATMVLNFHHYLVDGVIWKRRRKGVAATPGVSVAS